MKYESSWNVEHDYGGVFLKKSFVAIEVIRHFAVAAFQYSKARFAHQTRDGWNKEKSWVDWVFDCYQTSWVCVDDLLDCWKIFECSTDGVVSLCDQWEQPFWSGFIFDI